MQPFEELEQKWAEFNGLDPAGMVCCSSGTAALHLAFEALRLLQGSEVLMGDLNMIACPRAAVLSGLKPVFVDCDERLLIDPDLVDAYAADPKNNVYGRCSAILATHIYGRRCDMDRLWQFASDRGVRVVEDLAEAHGVKPDAGTDAACWSHYRNKAVGGEEGGTVWFRDPKKAALARQLRCLGFTAAHDYRHIPRGHNYRLANCLAEKILGSLERVEANQAARREVEAWYDAEIDPAWRMPPRSAVWVYDVILPPLVPLLGGPSIAETVVAALKGEGVEARCCFKPMREQEEFRSCRRFVGRGGIHVEPWPLSSQFAERVLYLPVQPGVTAREGVRRAVGVIREVLERRG